MFEASFRETLEALEAIRVDSRTGRDVQVEEGEDGLAPEIRDHFHSDAAGAPATPFYCDQNQPRPSPLELAAAAEAGCSPPIHVSSTSTSPYSGSRATF